MVWKNRMRPPLKYVKADVGKSESPRNDAFELKSVWSVIGLCEERNWVSVLK